MSIRITEPIRVAKYDYKTRQTPNIFGYTNQVIHVEEELSPYVLRDEAGVIHENLWQFNKIYRQVYAQDQTVHRWTREKGWVYPAEKHIDDKGNILPEYWRWRQAGMHNKTPVRYPNGYNGRKECVGFVMCTNGPLSSCDAKYAYTFIPFEQLHIARRDIYYKEYARLCRKLPEFHRLKELKTPLQIAEVDGPRKTDDYPFNLAENNSLIVNRDTARGWLYNKSQSFGHGICLCIALQNGDDWLN